MITLLETLLDFNLPKEVVALVLSALPVFELRGSLPVLINFFHFPWYYAFLLAIIGNMLPVPFLLLFWDSLSTLLARVSFFQKPLGWLFLRTRRRGTIVAKYGVIGLLMFVAIPLPVTGAWTASLIAVIFGIKFLPAFMAILGGVVIAGVIITCLSLLGWTGAVIAGAGFIGISIFSMWKTRTQKRHEAENSLIAK
ncbi:MAG: small multi-drug export protein [Chloroflexota bacterium]